MGYWDYLELYPQKGYTPFIVAGGCIFFLNFTLKQVKKIRVKGLFRDIS